MGRPCGDIAIYIFESEERILLLRTTLAKTIRQNENGQYFKKIEYLEARSFFSDIYIIILLLLFIIKLLTNDRARE